MKKIFLFISFIFLAGIFQYAKSQCNVTLGNDRTICKGSEVTLAANGDAMFIWSTGQTTPSITVSPTITTTYSIIATCTDFTTATDEITINVNSLPEVSLGNDFDICVGEEISLEVTGGYEYFWSNGSSNSSINSSPLITSTYWVLATDLNNCQNSDTVEVTVNPSPIVLASPNQIICLFETVLLTATTGGNSYMWNTGTQNSAIEVSPYVTSNYVVTVVDNNGCVNTDTTVVTVNYPPTADFTASEVCEKLASHFTNISYDNLNTLSANYWTFEPNINSTEINPNYIFSTSGVFNVQLIVENNKNCTDTVIKSVQVFPKPVADFNFTNSNYCEIPVTVNFNDISSNAVEWNWSFGNDSTSVEQYPETSYLSVGSYEIKQIVLSDMGCSDTIMKNFTVHQKPILNFSSDITEGCEPLEVNFYSQCQYFDNLKWYIDNQIFQTEQVNYTFSEGVYNLFIQISNEFCATNNENFTDDYITVFNTPETDFSYELENEPFPHGKYYFSNETLYGNLYNWNFGDSIISNEINPEHRYNTYGDFKVTLISTDTISMCTDTISYSLEVEYFDGLFIPTAFAPQSGKGDAAKFLPKGKHLIEYKIQVFSTSGNLMWQSNAIVSGEPAEFWDGTYKGQEMPQGVYFWKVYAIFDNNEVWDGQTDVNNKKRTDGTVTLIR